MGVFNLCLIRSLGEPHFNLGGSNNVGPDLSTIASLTTGETKFYPQGSLKLPLTLTHTSHSLALVNPHSMETPARYLGSEDRVMAVKNEPAAAGVMFVLCVFSSGSAILEIVNTIKQNVSFFFRIVEKFSVLQTAVPTQPAYSTAFDSRTRGYLVTMETGEGTGKRGKGMSGGDHRSWCVLDGSSLLCYRDEEVRVPWGT